MNLTYGLFKGDFLPYIEEVKKDENFWTGYYSTRLHLKRYITHVFNEIQNTKTLMAIRSLNGNSGTVVFNQTMKDHLEKVNEYITKAERKWAILIHHDAITGTHTIHTEPSYYKLLGEAQKYLQYARGYLKKYL